jgi:hypothetical protein
MAIEFAFVVTPTTITASVPGTEIRVVAENRVVYDAATRMILHAGKPGEEIPGHFFELTKKPGRQVRVLSVFTGGDEEAGPETAIMKLLTRYLHQATQKAAPFRYLWMKLFDQFDYSFKMESDLPLSHLQQLRDEFFVNFRMRKLVMNGHDLTIPAWRRNTEYWLRMFLVNVIPLLAMIVGYFFMPAFFRSNAILFLLFLCAVSYFFYFVGKGFWVLGSQWLVSRGYVRYLFFARRTRLAWVDRFWMDSLWKSGKVK